MASHSQFLFFLIGKERTEFVLLRPEPEVFHDNPARPGFSPVAMLNSHHHHHHVSAAVSAANMYPWYRDSMSQLGQFCHGAAAANIKTENGYNDCMLALDYAQTKVGMKVTTNCP